MSAVDVIDVRAVVATDRDAARAALARKKAAAMLKRCRRDYGGKRFTKSTLQELDTADQAASALEAVAAKRLAALMIEVAKRRAVVAAREAAAAIESAKRTREDMEGAREAMRPKQVSEVVGARSVGLL